MRLVFIIFCMFVSTGVVAQRGTMQDDAMPLHRAEKALTDVMVHDVFSPPAASRVYAYANVAAYEVFAHTRPEYASLHGQLRDFPTIPPPAGTVSSSLAAVYAFLLVGKQLVFSDSMLLDSMGAILRSFSPSSVGSAQYNKSLQYGRQIADSILVWAAGDHYRQTRSIRRYSYLKQPGNWNPTPPGYFAAVEPYWSKMRCLTLDSANEFTPAPVAAFSKDSGSAFYSQAVEVYTIGNTLTVDQKATADFWDCNPFDLITSGHLMFSSKKISPGGHWINITGLACRQAGKGMAASAGAYTLVSIALFDGFISCWDEKYRSNLIRPETFINRYIDQNWRPVLQTPPFPEYTSGHSVISLASAVVLTHIFGEHFHYIDNTETAFGLSARNFPSFMDAANEAALSRLYGGIHYRSSVVNGQKEGEQIGKHVLERIHLKKDGSVF